MYFCDIKCLFGSTSTLDFCPLRNAGLKGYKGQPGRQVPLSLSYCLQGPWLWGQSTTPCARDVGLNHAWFWISLLMLFMDICLHPAGIWVGFPQILPFQELQDLARALFRWQVVDISQNSLWQHCPWERKSRKFIPIDADEQSMASPWWIPSQSGFKVWSFLSGPN